MYAMPVVCFLALLAPWFAGEVTDDDRWSRALAALAVAVIGGIARLCIQVEAECPLCESKVARAVTLVSRVAESGGFSKLPLDQPPVEAFPDKVCHTAAVLLEGTYHVIVVMLSCIPLWLLTIQNTPCVYENSAYAPFVCASAFALGYGVAWASVSFLGCTQCVQTDEDCRLLCASAKL